LGHESDGRRPLRVLLVHGLGRTPLSCLRLARALRRAGCAVQSFPYAGLAEPYDGIVDRLVRRLDRLAAEGEYAVVGHSLGGVLLRDALPRVRGRAPQHLVMLGTPSHPPRAARLASGFAPFRWLAGECGARLCDPQFYARLPSPSVPCTVVAGTRGFPGGWSPFGAEPNDGLVAVSEARLDHDTALVTLPVAHTFMMSHPAVQAVVCRALGLAGGR
jgi:alpha-beta hydrolase superfamily lysophospholipase